MKVLKNENIIVFDVDGTLVKWSKECREPTPKTIPLDYGDEKIYLSVHNFHPLFLKHCSKRGDFVIVWSQNGVNWAEQVVKKLELEDYIDWVMAKPKAHVDDKVSISDIVGTRIYIKDE